MQDKKDWVKVVYKEADNAPNVKQGILVDKGEFIEVIGDFSKALISKKSIVCITSKNECMQGGQNGKRDRRY